MIIRKTERQYKRHVRVWEDGGSERHIDVVLKTVWWVLFVPVFSSTVIQKSNL